MLSLVPISPLPNPIIHYPNRLPISQSHRPSWHTTFPCPISYGVIPVIFITSPNTIKHLTIFHNKLAQQKGGSSPGSIRLESYCTEFVNLTGYLPLVRISSDPGNFESRLRSERKVTIKPRLLSSRATLQIQYMYYPIAIREVKKKVLRGVITPLVVISQLCLL